MLHALTSNLIITIKYFYSEIINSSDSSLKGTTRLTLLLASLCKYYLQRFQCLTLLGIQDSNLYELF